MLYNRCATLLLCLLLAACAMPDDASPDGPVLFTIKQDGSFPAEECAERNLEGRVVMLESKHCSHCRETLPVFLEACAERGVEPLVLDLSEEEALAQATNEFGVRPQFTPTFLFGCDYHIGEKSKEEYLALLDEMIGAYDG